jgi:two-component system nitrate/nitrite response regulator NarL
MRVIVIGTPPQRRDLHDALEDSAPHVVAEFDTIAQARRAGVGADAILVPAHEAGPDEDPAAEALTPREVQVLELVAEGMPNKTIADRLGISDQTVKFHIASLSGKLGAANRTDAVRRAVRRGLITL